MLINCIRLCYLHSRKKRSSLEVVMYFFEKQYKHQTNKNRSRIPKKAKGCKMCLLLLVCQWRFVSVFHFTYKYLYVILHHGYYEYSRLTSIHILLGISLWSGNTTRMFNASSAPLNVWHCILYPQERYIPHLYPFASREI